MWDQGDGHEYDVWEDADGELLDARGVSWLEHREGYGCFPPHGSLENFQDSPDGFVYEMAHDTKFTYEGLN
jgi:hypothetical protein